MAVGSDADGNVWFNGNIGRWIQEIKQWYDADKRSQEYMDFATYTFIFATGYAALAQKMWASDRAKLDALRPLLHQDAQGHHSMKPMQVLELLDFLADNLNDDFRRRHTVHCVEKVEAYIRDHYEGKNFSMRNGRLEIRGRLGQWIKDFSSWYEGDTGTSFSTLTDSQRQGYLLFVAMGYGQAAFNQWSGEVGGDEKIKGFQSLIATDAQGNLDFNSVNAFQILDYLVENVTDEFKTQHESEARNSARQFKPRNG